MKHAKLFKLNIMALCCTLGLITKKIINPFANVITEALHIPGGISTGFSIMFLVIAKELVRLPYSGVMMGTVQGLLALALGRVGSMGLLSPLGYILPGLAIDLVYWLQRRGSASPMERMVPANGAAAVVASLAANVIVFRLHGPVLWLYLCVSATAGTIYGVLGSAISTRISLAFEQYRCKVRGNYHEEA